MITSGERDPPPKSEGLRRRPAGDRHCDVAARDVDLELDGALEISQLERALGSRLLDDEEEDRRHYHTVGGLAMFVLRRIPRTGDTFVHAGQRFEVMDMDGNRVDRVLVTPRAESQC